MSVGGNPNRPNWPGDPAALTAEAVDFVAIGHVLANTCCWGGRSLAFYSLAQHALTVCKGVEELGGLGEGDRQRLSLHALLGDAWRVWLAGAMADGTSGKPSEKLARQRETVQQTVLQAAGLDPVLPGPWARALELTRLMVEAAERRDLAGAGIPAGAEDGGLLFPPLKARIRPMRPDRAAAKWLECFEALRTTVLRTADERTQAPGGGT